MCWAYSGVCCEVFIGCGGFLYTFRGTRQQNQVLSFSREQDFCEGLYVVGVFGLRCILDISPRGSQFLFDLSPGVCKRPLPGILHVVEFSGFF